MFDGLDSTHARWMNTKDLPDLIKEAKNLEQKKDVKPRVLGSIYSVILRKSSISPDIDTLTWLLPKFHILIERNSNDEWQAFNRNRLSTKRVREFLLVSLDSATGVKTDEEESERWLYL